MLRHLHVRNLAVLAEASVEWKAGFNVLTGETGAGKSIVVDSLSLLAGARASADLIRSGAETLSVAGVFGPLPPPVVSSLDTAGVAIDSDEIVIRREINRAGRNRVYANDQPITLRLLSEVAPALLRIHGQREELGLAQPELQRLWLDRQGGDDARELLRRVARRFADYRGVAERLERMSGNDRIHQERIDLLTFQLGEIERVGLTAGEDDQLSQERNLLRNSEAVFAALGGLVQRLVENDGSVSETLAIVHSELDGVGEWEPTAVEWGLEVDELRIRAQELARTVTDRLQSIDADPTRLAQIEERLAVVERICHKYGPRSDDVLERFAVMRGELDELDTDAVDRGELEQRVAQALADYREVALELSAARAAWADGFCQRLADELAELALADARIEIRLDRRRRQDSPLHASGEPVEFGEHGIDQVLFLFSPNPGEEPRPLARVASGGELARVYLALQILARAESEDASTLVFDEVDAGVGGVEAVVLGRKLRQLGTHGQILSVTHIPQVASQGEHQYQVSKHVDEGRTSVTVRHLEGAKRTEEIARMLGGETAGTTSIEHAEKMLAEVAG